MKYVMSIMQLPFNKILDGSKKIEPRLYDEKRQKVKVCDIIEFVNASTGEKVKCLVKGIAVFENFKDLVTYMPLELFGYDNKEEIRVRLERLATEQEQNEFGVVGFIIEPITVA